MHPRALLAIAAGKLTARALRLSGRGGTALPGLVAHRLDPRLPRRLGRQPRRARILVTGTNGKTTTARMLAAMFEAAEIPVLHNREGSNLMRGITGMLVDHATSGGRLPASAAAVIEADEATMPEAAAAIAPDAVVITNLFRDQLDRYGEVDTVAALWREALAVTPTGAALVLNADDPSVAEFGFEWSGPVAYAGIEDLAHAGRAAGASDARWCRACGGDFIYENRFSAHLGHWRCDGCGRSRPAPGTAVRGVRLAPDGATFSVDGLGELTMPLTGLYNVWNAAVAIAAARAAGLPDEAIRTGLAAAAPAFGRQERIVLAGRPLRLFLTKNPAGANQVVQLLSAFPHPSQVAVILNDRAADGHDVSWIWDVDYEALAGHVDRCWVGGDRAEDMALRLRYAGWPVPSATVHDPQRLAGALAEQADPDRDVFVIPTYTALLDFRAELVRRGAAARFWQS